MAQMNRRFRRPFTKVKRYYHWHREESAATSLAPNSTTTNAILEPADYNNNAALSPGGVTIFRIVGTVCVVPQAVVGTTSWMVGVSAADNDVAPYSPSGQALLDERWLWLDTGQVRVTTAVGQQESVIHRIDTKVRVACKDTTLRYQLFNRVASVGSVDHAFCFSILLVGDTG